MDEAHGLKNRNSTRARKLRMVAKSCKHRIMLTGEAPRSGGLHSFPARFCARCVH